MPEPPGVVLLADVILGVLICNIPWLAVFCCPEFELVNPVGNKPSTIPPGVGVVGVVPLGVKLTVNVPGVVGVAAFTKLAPGVVGVVGVVAPVVSTPLTVRTVSVAGFFIALMVCRI